MTIREKLINWLDWCDRARPYSHLSDDDPNIQKMRRALDKAWDALDRAMALGDVAVECCQSEDELNTALAKWSEDDKSTDVDVDKAQNRYELAWQAWTKTRDAAKQGDKTCNR